MVKAICILLVMAPMLLVGQEESNSIVKPGLLRAQGTFSFGKLLDIEETGIYLNGNLEYYFHQKFSARGDIYYQLKSADLSLIKMNHQLFSGVSYHIPTGGNFNPYVGVQPGIALSEPNFNLSSSQFTPLISSVIGFNYFAENWFHLFIDVRYVYGVHNTDNGSDLNLSEIRLSFGLGFNINTN